MFSGDDDQQVIVPLPLSFLRLLHSGIYTYDIRWFDDGWTEQGITSEKLAIIEGALSTIAQAVDGLLPEDEYGNMQSITALEYEIFSIDEATNPTGIKTITGSDLPSYVENPSALLCELSVFSADYCSLWIIDGTLARQTKEILSSVSYPNLQFVVPFNQGSTVFRLVTAPSSFYLVAKLIGWW